jgi:hypothetical protein
LKKWGSSTDYVLLGEEKMATAFLRMSVLTYDAAWCHDPENRNQNFRFCDKYKSQDAD